MTAPALPPPRPDTAAVRRAAHRAAEWLALAHLITEIAADDTTGPQRQAEAVTVARHRTEAALDHLLAAERALTPRRAHAGWPALAAPILGATLIAAFIWSLT